MAHLHRAVLAPTKLELLGAWLPSRRWAPELAGTASPAGAGAVRQLGAYRFDDPEGEVGAEAFLLTVGGETLHVPLTYRGAPLPGAEEHLVGETEHSVLGRRWVYDGCADPVWCAAAAGAVLTGGTGAEELVDVEGRAEPREPTATVRGTGGSTEGVDGVGPGPLAPADEDATTTVAVGDLELIVVRRVGAPVTALAALEGRWPGGRGVLAGVRSRPVAG